MFTCGVGGIGVDFAFLVVLPAYTALSLPFANCIFNEFGAVVTVRGRVIKRHYGINIVVRILESNIERFGS